MELKKARMSSFVGRGNKLIEDGKAPQAMELVERGLQYYAENIISAISPYAKADAGLIVLVLRHIADELEKGNPGAKELYTGMKEIVKVPALTETEKHENANRW